MEKLRSREKTGRTLAEKLARYSSVPNVLVLGLPRGGVEVAYEIAQALKAPLDVMIVRKIGVPGYKEIPLGVVSIGGARFINPDVVEEFHLSQEEIEEVVCTELGEVERLEKAYRGSRAPLDVRDRVAILVDDGIVTGSTMRTAIDALKKLGPARIVIAVGVTPLSTHLILGSEVEEIISLITPRELPAVGQFYEHFPQLTDKDVKRFLDDAAALGAHWAASGS